MYIRKFTFKPEDVNCKFCTEYKRKDGCTSPGCPWLAERIEAGAVDYREAVLEAILPRSKVMSERVLRLIDNPPSSFWVDRQHKNRMEMFNHRLGFNKRRNVSTYYAAMYLLTTSEEIYRRTANCFFGKGVEFDFAVLNQISMHNYSLYSAAQTIYCKSSNVTVEDMADPTIIDDEAFQLIINAILIAKYGIPAFNLIEEEKSNGN